LLKKTNSHLTIGISAGTMNSDRVDIPKEDIEARQFTFLVLYKFMI
jgi:hypothetical protein